MPSALPDGPADAVGPPPQMELTPYTTGGLDKRSGANLVDLPPSVGARIIVDERSPTLALHHSGHNPDQVHSVLSSSGIVCHYAERQFGIV